MACMHAQSNFPNCSSNLSSAAGSRQERFQKINKKHHFARIKKTEDIKGLRRYLHLSYFCLKTFQTKLNLFDSI